MMEMIYVVCQIAATGVCEEHRAPVMSQGPLACVYAAPAELAQVARPGWRIARWRCEPGIEAQAEAANSSQADHRYRRAPAARQQVITLSVRSLPADLARGNRP